ncbi:hypothetical protein ACLB2K_025628 [Fragaria x ananassa]
MFACDELDKFEEGLNHSNLLGWWIDDVEDGPIVDGVRDEFVPEVIVDHQDETTYGNFDQNEDGPLVVVDHQDGQTRQVDVETQARSRAAAKGKGKVVEENIPTPNKKAKRGRPKKVVQMRYETRPRRESSRQQEDDVECSSNSSTDSDDPNFDRIRDYDNEITSEDDDDVQFNHKVDGDPNLVNEWDEMGFEGEISDDDQNASDGLGELMVRI